jgi:putative oxidoreductase
MNMKSSQSSRLQGAALSVMRMMVALTFATHGSQKLLGFPSGKIVEYFSLMGFAGLLELAGGILLLLGFYTRPVAFILSGEMAVAYFMAHAHQGLWPVVNGGERAVLYCFAFLYLSMAGAGPLSLDRILRKAV